MYWHSVCTLWTSKYDKRFTERWTLRTVQQVGQTRSAWSQCFNKGSCLRPNEHRSPWGRQILCSNGDEIPWRRQVLCFDKEKSTCKNISSRLRDCCLATCGSLPVLQQYLWLSKVVLDVVVTSPTSRDLSNGTFLAGSSIFSFPSFLPYQQILSLHFFSQQVLA